MSAILVVDDDRTGLDAVGAFLEADGFEVDRLTSGKRAVAVLRKKKYELIMLDHLMPEQDGVETMKLIRAMEEQSGTPIVAMSGNSDPDARDFFVGEGFDDFVSKPITYDALRTVTDKWISK